MGKTYDEYTECESKKQKYIKRYILLLEHYLENPLDPGTNVSECVFTRQNYKYLQEAIGEAEELIRALKRQ